MRMDHEWYQSQDQFLVLDSILKPQHAERHQCNEAVISEWGSNQSFCEISCRKLTDYQYYGTFYPIHLPTSSDAAPIPYRYVTRSDFTTEAGDIALLNLVVMELPDLIYIIGRRLQWLWRFWFLYSVV